MNTENSKATRPHVLLLNLTDKIDLRRGKKSIALSNLSIYFIAGTKIINLKYHLQHGIMNLNYQVKLILHQIFKIILSIFSKNMEKILINLR